MPDLSPVVYHVPTGLPGVLAVGWLDGRQEFSVGRLKYRLARKIRRLIESPIFLTRGYHICEICPVPAEGPQAIPQERMGNGEVWLQGSDGCVYAFPTLLRHYVERHRYLPPAAFLDAVEAGVPLTEADCDARIHAQLARLSDNPRPEDILVPFYRVRLMWNERDFPDLTAFHTALSGSFNASDVGLRDFGFFLFECTHEPATLFESVRAWCQAKALPAPYGYRYREDFLRGEEEVVTVDTVE